MTIRDVKTMTTIIIVIMIMVHPSIFFPFCLPF